MTIPKRYLDDKAILLLLSANSSLTILTIVWVLLRLDTSNTDGYWVQYRADQGLDALSRGGMGEFVGFVLFSVFVLVFHSFLSMKVYHLRRHFAVAILGMGTLLLVLSLIISSALLFLR